MHLITDGLGCTLLSLLLADETITKYLWHMQDITVQFHVCHVIIPIC